MIADLKPYPLMKDSGAIWLGEIPKDWNVLRGRQLFEIKKRISGELGHPVISVTQAGLRVKDVESGGGQLSLDYSKYQTVGVGEFAMNSMDLLTGGVGIATSPGVTSPDYRVFTIRPESNCCDQYLLQVLRMLYSSRVFYAWGQGSSQLGRWRLPRKRFNDFPFPVPPHTEQVAIARFLAWANGRLERAFRAKRKVIALLNEQKQAIIHRAVTRGIDLSVPVKPSGIRWLGDIPLHWEVLPLGRVLRERIEKNLPVKTDNILSLSLHDGVVPYADKRAGGNKAKNDLTAYKLAYPGDIVLNSMNVVVGSVGLSKYFGAVSPVYYMLRPRSTLDAVEFFDALFHDPAFQRSLFGLGNGIMFIQSRATGKLNTIRMRIPMGKLNRVDIPYPPANEQVAIVQGIATQTTRLNFAISRLEREIELLREYRTRLVADVVTGKLDVREAAVRLPDEAPLDTAEVDVDLADDSEADDEEAVA